MIVLPQNIEFKEWADSLFIDLPLLTIPIAQSEDEWKDWASRTIYDNQLTTVPIPDTFEDWKIWAEYFVNSV